MRDLDLHALFLFNVTDTMAQPWADAGITCWCVDLQHPKGERRDGNIIRVGADVMRYTPPMRRYAFGFAFPPCTDLAVSGARWFAGKGLYALADAITLFARATEVMEALDAPYGIENPVSTISSYWRKPDYSFDPCDYAGYPGGETDTYTKKTCLWTGGASSCRRRGAWTRPTAAACICCRPLPSEPTCAAPRRPASPVPRSRRTMRAH